MRSLKKKRRVQVILVAAVALTLSTALIGYGMRDGINFFRSPSEVMAAPPPSNEVFRIGGLVEDGSLVRGQSDTVSFRVTDRAASVAVTYRGILPDLFAENQGMIGTGRLEGGVFVADEILAKHDETYMPREVVEALRAAGEWRPES
jgi:cytochrome c-type biogenesis protein CcmE